MSKEIEKMAANFVRSLQPKTESKTAQKKLEPSFTIDELRDLYFAVQSIEKWAWALGNQNNTSRPEYRSFTGNHFDRLARICQHISLKCTDAAWGQYEVGKFEPVTEEHPVPENKKESPTKPWKIGDHWAWQATGTPPYALLDDWEIGWNLHGMQNFWLVLGSVWDFKNGTPTPHALKVATINSWGAIEHNIEAVIFTADDHSVSFMVVTHAFKLFLESKGDLLS